ncbi:MAG TPA: host attachment protein [Tepidisphaeraceae bacterium]|nr:host attachment protein [Tepidisphaeraceae bacterium]
MNKAEFWLLMADAGGAILLRTSEGETASVIKTLDNPAGRMHTSDIVSDRQGRMDKKFGKARSAMEPHTNPHEQEAIVFARRLCTILDEGADRRSYEHLVLVAPDHFLGLLKENLGGVAARKLAKCETKDLMRATERERREFVQRLMRADTRATS